MESILFSTQKYFIAWNFSVMSWNTQHPPRHRGAVTAIKSQLEHVLFAWTPSQFTACAVLNWVFPF